MRSTLRSLGLLLCVSTTGCVRGALTTVGLGARFGAERQGMSLTLEHTLLLHQAPPPPKGKTHPGEVRSVSGWGVTGALTGGWLGGGPGWHLAAGAGVDAFPLLSEESQVSLGGLIGYGLREDGHGPTGIFPRVGFALTPWSIGTAKAGLGLRVDCQWGGLDACGPTVTAVRLSLGGP